MGAELRKEEQATDIDLLNVLIGFSSSNFESYKVLKRLGKTPGSIFRSLATIDEINASVEQVSKRPTVNVT